MHSYMAGRRIYDVTLTIQPDMLVWPGDPLVNIETFESIAKGDSANLSIWHLGSHTDTHVDAPPHHFIPEGPGVDQIRPEVLVGPARLFQLSNTTSIDARVLKRLDLKGVTRLLLGTHNSVLLSERNFSPDYVSVTEDAAQYLVDSGIRLVGIDYLSIEAFHKPGHPTHHTLLAAGVVIIEGLILSGIPEGDYELLCLPLKVKDADGAPARVFLQEVG